jgi:hypothetical protein
MLKIGFHLIIGACLYRFCLFWETRAGFGIKLRDWRSIGVAAHPPTLEFLQLPTATQVADSYLYFQGRLGT